MEGQSRVKMTMLRMIEQRDLEGVMSLIQRTIDTSYAGVYPQEAIDFFKDYHSPQHILEDAGNGYTIVLETDDAMVGTGTLLGPHIKRVFVDPDHQGRGLGRMIMVDLEERARTKELESVVLDSSLVSKRFYDHLGYLTRCPAFIDVGKGQRLDYYVMVKSLR